MVRHGLDVQILDNMSLLHNRCMWIILWLKIMMVSLHGYRWQRQSGCSGRQDREVLMAVGASRAEELAQSSPSCCWAAQKANAEGNAPAKLSNAAFGRIHMQRFPSRAAVLSSPMQN